jgi:hypothetical protein
MTIYNGMVKKVLESNNVFIDETPLKLQDEVKCKQAYIWVMAGGNESDPLYRVYDFRKNRRHDNVSLDAYSHLNMILIALKMNLCT